MTVRAATAGPNAVIEVADTGPGIDDADLPHVFDRLWRGRTAAGVAGRGIGLAAVREIVTAHGGTVTAASGPGTGPSSPSGSHGRTGHEPRHRGPGPSGPLHRAERGPVVSDLGICSVLDWLGNPRG